MGPNPPTAEIRDLLGLLEAYLRRHDDGAIRVCLSCPAIAESPALWAALVDRHHEAQVLNNRYRAILQGVIGAILRGLQQHGEREHQTRTDASAAVEGASSSSSQRLQPATLLETQDLCPTQYLSSSPSSGDPRNSASTVAGAADPLSFTELHLYSLLMQCARTSTELRVGPTPTLADRAVERLLEAMETSKRADVNLGRLAETLMNAVGAAANQNFFATALPFPPSAPPAGAKRARDVQEEDLRDFRSGGGGECAVAAAPLTLENPPQHRGSPPSPTSIVGVSAQRLLPANAPLPSEAPRRSQPPPTAESQRRLSVVVPPSPAVGADSRRSSAPNSFAVTSSSMDPAANTAIDAEEPRPSAREIPPTTAVTTRLPPASTAAILPAGGRLSTTACDSFDDVAAPGLRNSVGRPSVSSNAGVARPAPAGAGGEVVDAAAAGDSGRYVLPQRRIPFSKAEDRAILDGLARFTGPSRYTEIHGFYKAMGDVWHPSRTPKALYDRYRHHLQRQRLVDAAPSNGGLQNGGQEPAPAVAEVHV